MESKTDYIQVFKSECRSLTITIKLENCKDVYDCWCRICSQWLHKLDKDFFGYHFIDQDSEYGVAVENLKPTRENISDDDDEEEYENPYYECRPVEKIEHDDDDSDTDESGAQNNNQQRNSQADSSKDSSTKNNKRKADSNDNADSKRQDTNENNKVKDALDLTENKPLTTALIEAFKAQRLLWNRAAAANNEEQQQRKKCFEQIIADVKEKLDLQLNAKQVEQHISELCQNYDAQLKMKKLAEKQGKLFKPLWFCEKMDFLTENKALQTRKQRNKRGTKALANEKSALPLSNLTHAQNLQLIKLYENTPCLWHVEHIGFRFKTQRQQALDEMLQLMKAEMSCSYSKDELQKLIYRIRYACTQEKHRRLECERLQLEYKPNCKYYNQIAFLEPNVGPFRCELCSSFALFNGHDQYRIHKSTHDGSAPFTCPICKRGFMKVGNCTVHLRRHTRDYPFECKVCSKRFATSTDVTVHLRNHTGEKPYFCEVCGQSFRTWTFFNSHQSRHQKLAKYECSICAKAFYENNKLKEHMNAHLNVRDKLCNVCGKAFTSSKYLRQHKQIHAEKKKYVCRICSKDFAQYAGLSGHMKSHGSKMGSKAFEEKQQQTICV